MALLLLRLPDNLTPMCTSYTTGRPDSGRKHLLTDQWWVIEEYSSLHKDSLGVVNLQNSAVNMHR